MRGSDKINAAGSKAALHFLFFQQSKARLSLAFKTNNAAKCGSIYLVNLKGRNSNQYLDYLLRINRLQKML